MIGNKLEPFKFWCQKVLPNVYDDSLSYYEYLCKLNEYLNEVITQINTLTDNMSDYEEDLTAQWTAYRDELSAQWQTYKTYIDTYFDNLDVQIQINNKLDQMALNGTLSALIEPFVGTDIQNTVNAWLTEHVVPVGSAVVVDNTLTISGAAADAKVTGDKINNIINANVANLIEVSKNYYSTNGSVINIPYQRINAYLIRCTNLSTDSGYIGGAFKINNNIIVNNAPSLNNNEHVDLICPVASVPTDTITFEVSNINYRNISVEVFIVGSNVFVEQIICTNGGNYTRFLSDANNAIYNLAYQLTVVNTSYVPQHLPSNIQGDYRQYLLETIKPLNHVSTYQRLTLLNASGAFITSWERNKGSGDWSNWIEKGISSKYFSMFDEMIVTGSGGNYTTYLPNLNDALVNAVYKIVVTSSTNLPTNMPNVEDTSYVNYLLETYKPINDNNKIQTLTEITSDGSIKKWNRLYRQSQAVWSDWTYTYIAPSPLNITVGTGETYTSILEGVLKALTVPYSKVKVKKGNYNIAQEILAHYGNDFLSGDNVQYRGIPLGNYITVEFETGTIATLDLSDNVYSDSARSMVSIFNSGDSNPEYNNTGFTLINAHLIATNCRYCVHDEHGAVLDNYSNHYINCIMHKNRSMTVVTQQGRVSNYALGGGLGEHGYITFDGCSFSFTDTAQDEYSATDLYPIFYHTTYYSPSGTAYSRIYVRDCIIDTTIRFNRAENNGISEMYVSGCKLGDAPVADGNGQDRLIAWNNDITNT